MAVLNNVPGDPEVWKVGNLSFLVYMLPGTEADPVYLSWQVSSDADLQSMFGPDQDIVYDREVSEGQYGGLGVLEFGDADELSNLSDAPFITWQNDMERLSQVQPWILEADYQALVAMAILEGRQLTEPEIATTDWWQRHSQAERDWMVMLHGDPTTADQIVEDAGRTVADMLTAAGAGPSAELDSSLVDFLALRWVSGAWSESLLREQIIALTDPQSGQTLEPQLMQLLDSGVEVGSTIAEEDTVRELLNTWLGPLYGGWSDDEITRIAGEIRNNPEAEQRFVEQLKDQRLTLLPQYENREISYQSIANTWRNLWLNQWGQDPDETSELWTSVLRANDAAEAGEMLRREGLNQGVKQVVDKANRAALDQTTALVRSPV